MEESSSYFAQAHVNTKSSKAEAAAQYLVVQALNTMLSPAHQRRYQSHIKLSRVHIIPIISIGASRLIPLPPPLPTAPFPS